MIFRLRSVVLLLCAVALSVSLAPAATRSDLCPLSQVKAGQIAIAKSVFHGTKIESFRVKIIGVIPKYDGTKSVILGTVLDGPVVARKSGVIAGMSGSPVYINGKLAGAIALAWSFSKEPIAGITPIEDMLEAWREPAAAATSPASRDLPTPVRVQGTLIHQVQVSPNPPAQPDPPGVMTLVPLGGTIQASGFSPRVVAQLREQLEPYGVRLAAGGGGPMESLRPPLVPGAAVGARLVGGDFDMTGLGTVTMVEHGRVLAFGHPLLQLGAVDLPMTGGYVHDILPSLYLSNKIMSPTQVIGRVVSDHQRAIAGTVGGTADMLPITIEVSDAELGRAKTFRVQVARLRELIPSLVASCVMSAVDELRGQVARGTAEVAVAIETGGRTITREDLEYSPTDAAAGAVPAVLAPLTTFTENPFGVMKIDRIRVKVRTFSARRTAVIERLAIGQSRVKAGDTLTLHATIRPYGKAPVTMPLLLPLPEDLPKGQVRVVVTGGGDAEQARGTIGAPRPAPLSLAQLVQRYESEPKGSELILQASLPRPGMSLAGEELPNLPRTTIEALSATRPTDLRPLPSVVRVSVPTEWALTGRQALTIPVESQVSAPAMPKPPREEEPEEQGGEEEAVTFSTLPDPQPAASMWQGMPLGAPPRPNGGHPEEAEQKPAPLTKAPDAWTQSGATSYSDWKLRDVILAWDGSLSLGPVTGPAVPLLADVIWSLAVKDGVVFAGTGRDGLIYRVAPEGTVAQFFATDEMNVHALAFAPEGTLYAGTSPHGKVFRITPEGKGVVVLDTESVYVWALAAAPDGTVYAATGSPARLYALRPDGSSSVLAELPVTNALSLVVAPNGDLYIGTADAGLIYRVTAQGNATVVGQVPGASVDALALTADGILYATSSPNGQVYRILPGGKPELYLEAGQTTAFDLALLPDNQPAVATGPNGLLIGARARLRPTLMLRPDSGLATALVQEQGALYLATSGPAALRKLSSTRALTGQAESGVLDAERTARWGKIVVAAETPEGTNIAVETRAGETPTPGNSWSDWAPAVDGAVASPPARYLQYRLTLTSEKPEVSPVVRQVSVSRRPQNRAPNLTLRSPEPGQHLAKQQSLKWQAQDPDKDALTFRVDISADLGATWSELAKNLRDPKFEWDTTKQKDGRYLLRITSSDALSAPDDPLTGEGAAVIWVDNTAPTLVIIKRAVTVDDARRASLSPLVTDALSPLQSIEYRVDEGDWQSVPTGAVETMLATPAIRTDPLTVGKRRLSVRAFDAAGNMAGEAVELEVKEPVAKPEPNTSAPPPASPEAKPAEGPAAPAG